LSAMIASALSGKPTVNGASGLLPPDYPVSHLYQTNIVEQLNFWKSRHPGTGACLVATDLNPHELADRGPRPAFLGIPLMD
jgi:hypothetical protein